MSTNITTACNNYYASGVANADNRVNTSSASYTSGYNAGYSSVGSSVALISGGTLSTSYKFVIATASGANNDGSGAGSSISVSNYGTGTVYELVKQAYNVAGSGSNRADCSVTITVIKNAVAGTVISCSAGWAGIVEIIGIN
jgi:hypothetical protein